jgi:Flp pilus assembly protein TadG
VGNEGQTLVEMALLLPLLMLFVTGILSVGFAYSNQQALTQATGIAGQYLASAEGVSTDPCAEVRTAIHNAAPQLDLTQLNVTLTMNGTSVSTNTCTGNVSNLDYTGNYGSVTVYATYPCNIGVFGVDFSSSCKLQAQVTELEY